MDKVDVDGTKIEDEVKTGDEAANNDEFLPMLEKVESPREILEDTFGEKHIGGFAWGTTGVNMFTTKLCLFL